ncbi:MAG TPA: VOC family protein [Actinomycetota bacterium]|jgi:catechol 2,3-dioxygenase-like lactoylglutathione lyase family enzyme
MTSNDIGWPAWIGIVCEDLAAQRSFYGGVLRMRESDAGDGWVQFKLGDGLLELVQRDRSPQYDRVRYQVGFSVGDMETARRRMIDAGAQQIGDVEGGGEASGRWCYFRDPEGNVFEIKLRT